MDLVAKAADAALMFWQSLDQRERALLGYAAVWVVAALVAGARRRERDRMKADILEELVAGGGVRS